MRFVEKILSILRSVLTIFVMYIFFRYLIFVLIIWALIENIIIAVKKKKGNLILDFLCNFVTGILTSINYIMNILLAIPANRMLLKSSDTPFGRPGRRFTQTLRMNIVKGTIKPRSIMLYKIFESIRKFGTNGL